jgi:hypothetical protein
MSAPENREKALKREVAPPLGTANADVSALVLVKSHYLKNTSLLLYVAASYSDHP